MTADKKTWVKIGFSLIIFGFILPIIIKLISYFLDKAHVGLECKDLLDQRLISFKGFSAGGPIILIIAGILCILPISDWIKSWRNGKKK